MQSNHETKTDDNQEKENDMTVITNAQKKKLDAIEARMRGNLESFVQMGLDLEVIFQERLYKVKGYQTFEDYCRKEWEWSKSYVLRLRQAAEVRLKLPSLEKLPRGDLSSKNVEVKQQVWTEKAIRPLTSLPPGKQRQVGAAVAKAVAAGEAKPTSTTVKRFIRELVPESISPRKEPAPPPEKPMIETWVLRYVGDVQTLIDRLGELSDEDWRQFASVSAGVFMSIDKIVKDTLNVDLFRDALPKENRKVSDYAKIIASVRQAEANDHLREAQQLQENVELSRENARLQAQVSKLLAIVQMTKVAQAVANTALPEDEKVRLLEVAESV